MQEEKLLYPLYEQGTEQVTEQAKLYAAATSMAYGFVQDMQKDFKVQFKSSDKAFNEISRWVNKGLAVQLLGKSFQARIIWSWVGGVHEQTVPMLRFDFDGQALHYPLYDSSFRKAFLQKGDIDKMFKLWHFVKSTVGGKEVYDKHLHY